MKVQIFQIDSFTQEVFAGNPAAVCPLDEWISDELMLQISSENNLSETAFFVQNKNTGVFDIRWFTPVKEVNLCGHATLATAYVIFHELNLLVGEKIEFNSKSGALFVELNDDGSLTMDFPLRRYEKCQNPELVKESFGVEPQESYRSVEDYIFVYDNEKIISEIKPNFHLLQNLDCRGVIITAKGKKYDFVSRFFAPKYGIDEDPVTGSAHCVLLPLWAGKLNKNILEARQVSQRGGEIICGLKNGRAFLSGYAKKYLSGIIDV